MTIENLATRFSELAENLHDLTADSLINPPMRAPLSGIHAGYYRSKMFTVNTGLNPLVNAATPLLAIVNKLKILNIAPDIAQLYQDLCHEIKAFENKAQTHHYRSTCW